MPLEPILQGLPDDLKIQLMSGELVYYFSYISFGGGCGSSGSRSNYWIALTNKRVLYKSRIQEDNKTTFIEKDGILPLEKISFMEVEEKSQSQGCSTTKMFMLKMGTSGGHVAIPVPTKDKCYEIIRVYSEITQG